MTFLFNLHISTIVSKVLSRYLLNTKLKFLVPLSIDANLIQRRPLPFITIFLQTIPSVVASD